jgi:hypothetical protein
MKHKRLIIVLDIMIILTTILAVVAVVLPVYTIIQDLPGLSFGTPSYNYTNSSGYFILPVTISSKGPLSLSDITLQGYLAGANNTQLPVTSVGPIKIPVGSRTTINLNTTFDFSQLSDEMIQNLATINQNLSLVATFRFSTSPLSSYKFNLIGQYNWGAPLDNLTIGYPYVQAFNTTYSQVSIGFTFKDNSSNIMVDGYMSGIILDSSGNIVGVLQNQSMTVYPGATHTGTMAGYIRNDALGQPSYTVKLLFYTDLGEFEEEVNSSA